MRWVPARHRWLKGRPTGADTDGVHSRVRRLLAATVVALIASVLAATTALAGSSDESRFVSLMNASRGAAGLAPLTVDPDLVDDARRHTAAMIERGDIFHSSDAQLSAATSGWTLLGENVGMGPNPDILHQAFMASPSHRANILGAFNYVGVGTGIADDGTMFVTVIFAQKPVPASVTSTTATTLSPITTMGGGTTTVTTSPATNHGPRRTRGERARREVEAIARQAFLEGTFCIDLAPYGRGCVE